MSDDSFKDMSRRSIEMWSSNNSERPEDIFTENYINHQEPDVEGGTSDKSLEAWKELVSGYHEAFSDSKVRVLMPDCQPRSGCHPLGIYGHTQW